MTETVIDLTTLQESPRLHDSRWTIWEKTRKTKVQTDPTLAFKSSRIIPNENYIITEVHTLTRVPPQSLITKLRAQLIQLPDHVLVWNGYGVFDWDALNALSGIHQRNVVAKQVQEEFSWIRNNNVDNNIEVSQFMYKIWHGSSDKDRESLLCNRLLTDGVVKEMLDICNNVCDEKGDNSEFFILNNRIDTTIDRNTKFVHLIINVSRNSNTTYVTPESESGSHWTYMFIDLELNTAVYSDSLGWSIPADLRQILSKFFPDARQMKIRMLHQPNVSSSNHICSKQCSQFAPLQRCSSVCGVAALALCVLSFDKANWKAVLKIDNSDQDNQLLTLISQPTLYSDQLRFTVMACLETRKVRLDVLKDFAQTIKVQPNKHVNIENHQTVNRGDSNRRMKFELKDLIKVALKRKKAREDAVQKKVRRSDVVCDSDEQCVSQSGDIVTQEKYDTSVINQTPKTDNVGSQKTNPVQEKETNMSRFYLGKKEEKYIKDRDSKKKHLKLQLPENLTKERCTTTEFTNTATGFLKEEQLGSGSFDRGLLEKCLLKQKLKKSKKVKRLNENKFSQTNIKSIFEKMTVNMVKTEKDDLKFGSKPLQSTFPDYVYTQGLTLKGLSKGFYKNIGRNVGKNENRNANRKHSPLIEEKGRVVGLKRRKEAELERQQNSSKYLDAFTVDKIKNFLSQNGPVVKTQTVCEFYQSVIKSQSRLMSSEFVEKLGKYMDITQIYINGTGYIIKGQYEHLLPVVQQLEELCKSKEKENFKSVIETKIKDTYADALNSLQSPFDRQIMKGLMATMTNPDFMTKLEGKQNKTGYRNSKDTYASNVNKYREIERTSLVVRNDLTNYEQRSLTKRLIARRKKKELQTVFNGRGRALKSEQYPELAAVLELCFNEIDIMDGGGGLESHPRLTDGVLYKSCGNSFTMKRARDIILTIAPENFKISLSTCYNYTENYRANSHQAQQHHVGKGVNAQISLSQPPRTGVSQFVVNLHWSTANVNLVLDKAHENQDNTFVDSKDAKSIVCANIAPVQKPGKSWSKREYLDHDWDQSRTYAVTPMTHLILETEKITEIQSGSIVLRTKRTGRAITMLNISFFEPETAHRSLNELFLMIIDPKTSEFFRNPITGDFKKDFIFVVDNGPSTAPGNMLVKMCLVRIFLLLNLNSLCQVSYAEYHSKRNPVERVHAEENKALSRHGPFVIDTHLLKHGSAEHKRQMEIMVQEVSSCIQTGQFNKENIVTLRGSTEDTNIFNDEKELKTYLSYSEDVRETFTGTYCIANNTTTHELDMVWQIDTEFKRKYADDYNEITENGKMNKYMFKVSKEEHEDSLQPVPDYTKYEQTQELHYCDYALTKRLFELSENVFVKNETDFFLPSQVLNMAYLVFNDPPNHIKVLLSLLAWVTTEEYDQFIRAKDEEETKVAEKDRDYMVWRSHDMYKLKKKELISLCKNQSKIHEGTKIELVKRLSESHDLQNETPYSGDLGSIPNTVSGISTMCIAYIRLILSHHGVKTAGSKEELVLRLYILKHQPDLLFKKEKEGLLDMLKVCQHFIQIQFQQSAMSLDSERMFPSSKLSTTRQKVKNSSLSRSKVQLPCHVNDTALSNLFQPLIEYIKNDLKHSSEAKTSTSLTCMTTPGNTVKVKWLKDEVNGSGWHPGWYSATVRNFNRDIDELTVEYDSEKGYTYNMQFTDMVSRGMIEPSKPLLAHIEMTEKIQTIGQMLEIKWSKDELAGTNWQEGWYEAVVIGADVEEDTVTVRYTEEAACTYIVEVTPAINTNSVRIKK